MSATALQTGLALTGLAQPAMNPVIAPGIVAGWGSKIIACYALCYLLTLLRPRLFTKFPLTYFYSNKSVTPYIYWGPSIESNATMSLPIKW